MYVGCTQQNVMDRLKEHNAGKCVHSSKYKPWKLSTYIYFDDAAKASAFEKYLKSGSGRAFSKRHL
jgi:putative endonuclease